MPDGHTGAAAVVHDVADRAERLLGWVAVAFGLAAGAYSAHVWLTTPATTPMATLQALLVIALGLGTTDYPPRIDVRNPATAVGQIRTVDRTFDPESRVGERCVVCGEWAEDGEAVVRRYREEYVVGWLSLWTSEEGDNRYCEECSHDGVAAGSVEGPPAPSPPSARPDRRRGAAGRDEAADGDGQAGEDGPDSGSERAADTSTDRR